MKTPRPPGLLVLAVLALHLLVGHEVQRIADGWRRDGPPPMPARMQVAMVREMTLADPPAPGRAAAAAPAPRTQATTAAAARADDAPKNEAVEPAPAASAASAPDLQRPEPASTSASASADAASSAPDVLADAASSPPDAAASAAAAAAPNRETEGEPGPEWPLSTWLTYDLHGNYRGPIHGQAQVQWLRKGRDYQVNLDISLGPSFAPLMTRSMSSQGVLTPEGIAPQRYDEETRLILGTPTRATVFFLPAQVQLATGVREPAPPGAQDAASQFVQLTWLFLTGRQALKPGETVTFPLVPPRRQYAWQYQVLAEERLDTPMGRLAAWHLRPTRAASGGDLSAEVWLAPSMQYLPVRLLIRQNADTYIDMTLKAVPLQAAPESADDNARRLSQ